MDIEAFFNSELKDLSREEKEALLKLKKIPTTISAEETANAFYQCTKVYYEFIRGSIYPVLCSQFKLNNRENVFLGLFLRTFLRLEAIINLQSPKYFETIASTLRTTFEIMIDCILISDNKIENAVEKYYKYVDAQKYEYARKYINGVDYSKLDEAEKDFYELSNRHISETDKKINFSNLCKSLWGEDKLPKTWTGKDIYDNAKTAGFSNEYRYLYTRICWDVHSGVTNISGFENKYFVVIFGINHFYIQKFLQIILKIVAKEFHLYKAKPGLDKSMEIINQHIGAVLLKKQIDIIKAKRGT